MLQLISSRARNAVSRDKFRFIDGELNLDLTYITDRIVAMGLPGAGVEKVWRNELEDVARFFQKYHAEHFIIINLSGEVYDYSKFQYRVKDYGYPDHSALPLEHLFQIMSAMKYYLDEDPSNIVAVHCLAGRGRTGTVISAFLLYLGLYNDATEALRYFANARSSKGEGVITPSQLRYVGYYNEILQGRKPDPRGKEKKLLLDKIIMEPCPVIPGTEEKGIQGGWTPVVQICTLAGTSITPLTYDAGGMPLFVE
ncbi:Proteintyrosine phosphatase [Acanthamoeba castellanii str. Neff]|uniref:Proteintyrosine phosphatase n=1 Tax=Acanthamoeba castellanii (strain ATCC 30010 / Neff) TaxID=1257118 RepID=L8GIF7_ACACF|nr:Proteintyrosine phosphatase [Acanthamoeba castellanii str. Neff]ELR12538.1 Proteintyrosine phosphatase [Acanthamoeba castellanii str. Neff]